MTPKAIRPLGFALLLPLLAALPAPLASAMLEGGCSASDFSGGVGGQDVGCAFDCEADSKISLQVTATDPDADVQGSADCGDASANCDGQKACSDEDDTSAAGAGTCEGHSSEVFDSGLRVRCRSDKNIGPGPSKICVAGLPCIPPETLPPLGPGPQVPSELQCGSDSKAPWCKPLKIEGHQASAKTSNDSYTGVTIWMTPLGDWAEKCVEGRCISVVPLCLATGEGRLCRVG